MGAHRRLPRPPSAEIPPIRKGCRRAIDRAIKQGPGSIVRPELTPQILHVRSCEWWQMEHQFRDFACFL